MSDLQESRLGRDVAGCWGRGRGRGRCLVAEQQGRRAMAVTGAATVRFFVDIGLLKAKS